MKTEIRDKDLGAVEEALRRAAIQARKIAEQTNTPLVIYKDGHILKQDVGRDKNRDTA